VTKRRKGLQRLCRKVGVTEFGLWHCAEAAWRVWRARTTQRLRRGVWRHAWTPVSELSVHCQVTSSHLVSRPIVNSSCYLPRTPSPKVSCYQCCWNSVH